MKKLLLIPFLFLFLIAGCSSDDSSPAPVPVAPLEAQTLMNIAYGGHAQQKMDVYLPAGRNNNTKVIVLVHGGSWVGGSKEEMAYLVPTIQSQFPEHAVVNINYRLASEGSPAYPKQINDIQQVLEHLETGDYHISDDYAFIGFSAGAHLSMLYSYKFDTEHNVKAVVNIVGPADFTDPEYLSHPLYAQASLNLIGTSTPTIEQIAEVSPVSHITAQAPPTITFYGGLDPLVPATQGPRLEAKLNQYGVYNEYNIYSQGGHGDWNGQIMVEVYSKIINFLTYHWDTN